MKTVEELEEKIEQCKTLKKDLNEALDEIIKNAEQKSEELRQQEKTEWEPENEEKYWYVDIDTMTVRITTWYDDENDNIRLNHKVVFKTEQEAEEYLQYLIAREKAINKFNQRAWKNSNMKKYYIYHNNSTLNIDFACEYHHFNAPYFWTEKDAQEFIDKYEKFIKRDMRICERN